MPSIHTCHSVRRQIAKHEASLFGPGHARRCTLSLVSADPAWSRCAADEKKGVGIAYLGLFGSRLCPGCTRVHLAHDPCCHVRNLPGGLTPAAGACALRISPRALHAGKCAHRILLQCKGPSSLQCPLEGMTMLAKAA